MKYSVIVPVHNESKTIAELCSRIFNVFHSMGDVKNFEILILDDGSTDSSKKEINKLQSENKYIKGIFLRNNMGKSFALTVGFLNVDSDYIITMDGDLQDSPEDIPLLIKKLDEGYDLVTGWRQNRSDGVVRAYGSRLFNYVVSRFGGIRLHDFNCGFKIYKSKVIKNISVYGQFHRFIPLLAHLMGFRVTEAPVSHCKRKYGFSNYPAFRYNGIFDLMSILFTYRYSFSPLYFFGMLGFVVIIPSVAAILFIAYRHTLFVLGIGEDYISKTRFMLPLSFTTFLLGINIFLTGFVCDFILYHQNKKKFTERMQEMIERE
jgi:glycosyltransferase involved in cell wall biosynthesis